MNLQEILFVARARLRDLGVKEFTEAELIAACNEGVSDICSIFRQAREDYFLTSTISTIPVATAGYPSTISLPTDFLELKTIRCLQSGFESIEFISKDQSLNAYKRALDYGGSYTSGNGVAFYDIYGNAEMSFVPGLDTPLQVKIDYIQTVPDLTLPADTPSMIPAEFHHHIVNYIVTEGLRSKGDKRLAAYLDRVKEEEKSIACAIQPRQIKEPRYVTGFLEDEEY